MQARPGAALWVNSPGVLRQKVQSDERRIVVAGARGWIGRSLLELLDEALGPAFDDRVACFGSTRQTIELTSGRTVNQAPLEKLSRLDCRPTAVFHLAFQTMDKVGLMSTEAYARTNQAISRLVLEALDPIGADRLFLASSGAAAFADDPSAAANLRLYGGLKRDDESIFACWAGEDPISRQAAICRIYSVSGPFINKHATYALADLILRAQRGEPITVQAKHAVWRSYVAVSELLALALSLLLGEHTAPVQRFDSGGEPIELGALARRISALTGAAVTPREIAQLPENRYCGDHAAWLTLLHSNGLTHSPLDHQIADTARWLAELDGLPIRF